FHVELVSLPDTYLKDLLWDKIPLIKKSGSLISNNEVDIKISFVSISKIKEHLTKYCVKNSSPQLLDLIAQRPVDNSSFTGGFLGDFFRVGEGDTNNLYISDISKAFGVQWNCDAEQAITAKARDTKSQILSA